MAIDIGASSGRHILGHIENGRLLTEEIYRFENSPKKTAGGLVWDTEELLKQIIAGIKKCNDFGKRPVSVGVDTWGVDYVLFDKSGREIAPVFAYRDSRTEKFLNASVSEEEMYARTGIQKHSFNTVFQLLADKASGRLETAAEMLMLPEYFSYKLTGRKANEYTEATTGGLVGAVARDWDYQLIKKLGLPETLFKPLVQPGYILGEFSPEIQKETGFNSAVVLPATHDTASAVIAVPEKGTLFISSGTWSLLGIETNPVLTEKARLAGYTNEGSVNGKIRLLKNIMGLWIIQQVRRELPEKLSFAKIAEAAEKEAVYDWKIDINDDAFFAPDNMTETVKEQCRKQGQPVPRTTGELAHCVYNSLAHSYKKAIDGLESLTGAHYGSIWVVGGGCNNDYLNKLTARITGRKVFAGPAEATAVGNLIAQLVSGKKLPSFESGKQLIKDSFEIKEIR